MKVKFTLLTLVLCAAISSAMASGTQPGTWRWLKPTTNVLNGYSSSASFSGALAPENTSTTIQNADDVVSLRWQIFSGSLSSSLFQTGYLALQYLDGGTSAGTAPASTLNTDDASARGVNQGSGSNNFFTSNAQTIGWRTIANEGTVFAGRPSESGGTSQVTGSSSAGATRAAFVMSSINAAVADQSYQFSPITDVNNYLPLTRPTYYSGSSGTTATTPQEKGYAMFTSKNGNTNQMSSAPSDKTMVLELEFHFKSAFNKSLSGDNRFGLIPGHRYFFRLRGYGSNSLNQYGYQSPSGVSSSRNTYGDYRVTPPFAYLDVSNDFIQRTLPVTLTSFNANLNGGKVNLAWATATEIANSGFEILKGINSNSLEQSKFVASKAASNGGNSSTTLNYTSIDSFPVNNATNYYQLKQIDLDGNTSYSDKVSVYVTGATTSLTVGPNPAVSVLNVNNLKTGSNLRVISLSGAVVKSQIVNANSVSLDIANLPSGVYIVEVVNLGGIKESHKFVKK